jgi:hypothetical protein
MNENELFPEDQIEQTSDEKIAAGLTLMVADADHKKLIVWDKYNPQGMLFNKDFKTKKELKEFSERMRDQSGWILLTPEGQFTTQASVINVLDSTGMNYIYAAEREGVIKCKTNERRELHCLEKDFENVGTLMYAFDSYLQNEDYFTEPIVLPNIDQFISGNPFEPDENFEPNKIVVDVLFDEPIGRREFEIPTLEGLRLNQDVPDKECHDCPLAFHSHIFHEYKHGAYKKYCTKDFTRLYPERIFFSHNKFCPYEDNPLAFTKAPETETKENSA